MLNDSASHYANSEKLENFLHFFILIWELWTSFKFWDLFKVYSQNQSNKSKVE